MRYILSDSLFFLTLNDPRCMARILDSWQWGVAAGNQCIGVFLPQYRPPHRPAKLILLKVYMTIRTTKSLGILSQVLLFLLDRLMFNVLWRVLP